MWAFLDDATLDAIVQRSVEPRHVAALYRGCTLLRDRRVQVADRAVLVEIGWSWLDSGRTGEVVASSDSDAVIAIRSANVGFLVSLAGDGQVPVPTCGTPLAREVVEQKYRVVRIERLQRDLSA